MLNRRNQKTDAFCLYYYFLFYVLFLTAGCFGVGKDPLPKRNETLHNTSEEAQENLFRLNQMLENDDEKKQLEQKVNKIEQPNVLEKFIKQSLQNRIAYNALLVLLPKPERAAFKQKFVKAVDTDAQIMLIDEISNALKMIKHATVSTQRDYIDLLEILPDHKAIALKNNIVHATTPDEVRNLIASEPSNPLKMLNDRAKEKFFQLSPDRRQKLLKELLKAPTNQKQEDASAQNPNNGYSTTPTGPLDIHTLLEQKFKEQEQAQATQQNQNEDIPQDEWGPKLPLKGYERKQFFIYIMQLDLDSQKDLKELFKKTEKDSLTKFFSIFFKNFKKDEGIELLGTMAYLYKESAYLALKICNQPKSLGLLEKMRIGGLVGTRVPLLKKLNRLLA